LCCTACCGGGEEFAAHEDLRAVPDRYEKMAARSSVGRERMLMVIELV